jgi:Family of unknown function (DUF6459)
MPALPPERPGCPKAPGGRRPLPDPAAIQLFLVPESAPPYDEEIPAGETGGGRLPAWSPHGTELRGRGGGKPEGRPARDETGGASRPLAAAPGTSAVIRRTPAAAPGTPAAARWTPAAAPGTPAAAPGLPPGWENRFAQVLAETLAGARPPRQIVPWTTEEARRRIQRLSPRLMSEQRPRVRRVLTSLPAPDVLEMTVVVGFGPRVKALAVRLEQTGAGPAAPPGQRAAARWVCTAVEAA